MMLKMTTMKSMAPEANEPGAGATTSRAAAHFGRRAFTLIELLVVIGVILVLVVATLPAFRALGDGTRSAGGVNGVSAALSTARSLASRHGRDVAVLFKFDVRRQVTSMQFLVLEGTTHDADGQNGGMDAASVFVPIDGQPEIELPKGVGVYGYGYGATRGFGVDSHHWYSDAGNLYESANDEPYDPWVFPRTDPRFIVGENDPDDEDLEYLESFIVRFAPDGSIVTNAEEFGSLASGGDSFVDLELAEENSPGARREWDPRVADVTNGDEEPIGELHLRPAPFIAVVDLVALADATGIRQPSLVVGETFRGIDESRVDSNGNGPDQLEIDSWIHQNAPIVAFNRYTGELMMSARR